MCFNKSIPAQKPFLSSHLPTFLSIQVTLNPFWQPTKDTIAYTVLGKSVENVAAVFLFGFMQLVNISYAQTKCKVQCWAVRTEGQMR